MADGHLKSASLLLKNIGAKLGFSKPSLQKGAPEVRTDSERLSTSDLSLSSSSCDESYQTVKYRRPKVAMGYSTLVVPPPKGGVRGPRTRIKTVPSCRTLPRSFRDTNSYNRQHGPTQGIERPRTFGGEGLHVSRISSVEFTTPSARSRQRCPLVSRESLPSAPGNEKESLMQDLEKERLLRVETEQRLAEMTVESDTCKSRLLGLQDEFKRMEEMVRGMMQYKTKLDQLKLEKANLTITYEDHIEKYKTQISNLEQENMLMMNEMRKLEAQLNERPDSPEKSKILLERLKTLEAENSALVLENETQRQSYEKCLDEIANQVVQALLTQKCLREECTKLQRRVFELESYNKQLQTMFQSRLRHSSDAAMLQSMSGKKLKSRNKAVMLIEGSTQSLPGQRSFIPVRHNIHHGKHTRHYSHSTFTGMEPNVDALPTCSPYDHDYNDNAYCDTPCMPQLSSPPPWLREKLKLIPLNDDTAPDNAYQYHSNLDAESLTTKSPNSDTPVKSAESKIQQITNRLFAKGIQTDNVDKVLSSKGQHSNHSGYHSNNISAQDFSKKSLRYAQNSSQRLPNFTLNISNLPKHKNNLSPKDVNLQVVNPPSRQDPSPGRELLCMSDSFEMQFTGPEGVPIMLKNYDTDDEASDASDSESSSDDQKQYDRHSSCSSFSLNDILENGLDICETPSDDNFSLDQYPLFLENNLHRDSLRRGSLGEKGESLKKQIIENCKATISTSKLSHSVSDCNEISLENGQSSPVNLDLKRPISLDVLLESSSASAEVQESKSSSQGERPLNPVSVTLGEELPLVDSEKTSENLLRPISTNRYLKEPKVEKKEEVKEKLSDTVKRVFSSGNSDSAFEEQILSPGEDNDEVQPQEKDSVESAVKDVECLKEIFVTTETGTVTEDQKNGAAEAEKPTNQLQPARLQVKVDGPRNVRSACSSPGSEYNYERSGSADDGYSTMTSDVNPEMLENFANAVKPTPSKDGEVRKDSTILRSSTPSNETLKNIPISRTNSREEDEVFKENVATIKRMSLCELKDIKEEGKESVSSRSSREERRSSSEACATVRRRSRAESVSSVASTTSQASVSSVESDSIGRVCDIKGYFEKEADKQRRSVESLTSKRRTYRRARPMSEPSHSLPRDDTNSKHHSLNIDLTPTTEAPKTAKTTSPPLEFSSHRLNQIRCSLCKSPRKKRHIRTSPTEDGSYLPNIHSDTSLAFHQSDDDSIERPVPLERAFSDSELHNGWIDKALESPEIPYKNNMFYKHVSVSDLAARFERRMSGQSDSMDSSLDGLDQVVHVETPIRQVSTGLKQGILLLSSDSDSDVDASINYVELWRQNHLEHMPLPTWDPKKTMDDAKKQMTSTPSSKPQESKVKKPEVKPKVERPAVPSSLEQTPKKTPSVVPKKPKSKICPPVPPRQRLKKLDPKLMLGGAAPKTPSPTKAPVHSTEAPPGGEVEQNSLKKKVPPPVPKRTTSKLSKPNLSPINKLNGQLQSLPTEGVVYANTQEITNGNKNITPKSTVSKIPKFGTTSHQSRIPTPKNGKDSQNQKIASMSSQNSFRSSSEPRAVHSSTPRDTLPDLISPVVPHFSEFHIMHNEVDTGSNLSAWNIEGCRARPCSVGSQPKLTVDNLTEIDTSLTSSSEALLPIDTHFKRDFYSICQVESNRSTPSNLSAAASLDKLPGVHSMNGSLASLKNLPWKTNSDPNCSRLGEDNQEMDEISQQIADLSKTVDDLQRSLSSLNSISTDSEADKCEGDIQDDNSISWPEFTISNLSSSLSSLDVSTASINDSDAMSDKYVWMDDDIQPHYDETHDDVAAFDASDEFDWMSFATSHLREGSEPRYLEMEMELKENEELMEKETEFMDEKTRENILDAVVATSSDDDDYIGNDPEMREIAGKMPRRQKKKGKRAVVRHAVHTRPHVDFQTFFVRYEDAEKKALSHFGFLKKYAVDEIEKSPTSPLSPNVDGMPCETTMVDVSNRENIAPVPHDLRLPVSGAFKRSPDRQSEQQLSPISENTESAKGKKSGREKISAFGRMKSLSLDNKTDSKDLLKKGKELDKKEKEKKSDKPKLRFGFKGLNGSKRRASAPVAVELLPPVPSTSSETEPQMTELEKAIAISTGGRGDSKKTKSKGHLEKESPKVSPKHGLNFRKSASVKVKKSSTKTEQPESTDSQLFRSQSAKNTRPSKGKKTVVEKTPSPKSSPEHNVPKASTKTVTPVGGSPKRTVGKIDSRIPTSSRKADSTTPSMSSSSPSPPPVAPSTYLTPDIVPKSPEPPAELDTKVKLRPKYDAKQRAEKRKIDSKKADVRPKVEPKKSDSKQPPKSKLSRLPVSNGAKDKNIVDTPLWAPPKTGKAQQPAKGRSPSVGNAKQAERKQKKELKGAEGVTRLKSPQSIKPVDTELVLPPAGKEDESDLSQASSLSEEIFNSLSMSFDDRCKTVLHQDGGQSSAMARDPYLDNLSDSFADSYSSSNDELEHAVYSEPKL